MQITRYPSLSEEQFRGCVWAFVDSLFGELNSAAAFLRKLEHQPKGSAFAFEMSLDRHRYGALLSLDRWATLVNAFGGDPSLARDRGLIDAAPARVLTAENLLGRANRLIDAAEGYTPEVVNACTLAWQSLNTTFAEEREAARRTELLGPMIPEECRQARGIFLEDLAAR